MHGWILTRQESSSGAGDSKVFMAQTMGAQGEGPKGQNFAFQTSSPDLKVEQ